MDVVLEVGDLGILKSFDLFDFWYRYNRFSRKPKSVNEFLKSPYRKTFVDLHYFVSKVYLPSAKGYLEWLINNRVASRDWCKEPTIRRYKSEHSRIEDAIMLVTRSLEKISLWCDEREFPISEFFSEIGVGEALNWIQSGRLSPWILFCSSTADRLFERMDEDQARVMDLAIDIDYWTARIKVSKEHCDRISLMLGEIGL